MVKKRWKSAYFIPVGILYLIFIGGGFFSMLIESLGYIPVFGMNDLTTASYVALFSDKMFVSDLMFSIYVSAMSSLISIIAGIYLSFKLIRSKNTLIRRILKPVFQAGMILPYLYMVFVVMLLFRNSGIISRLLYQIHWIDNLDQFPSLLYDNNGIGIIITYVLKGIPFVTLFSMNIMEQISTSYDDVGSLLGAGEYRLLKNIYLPLSEDMTIWCGMILFAYDFGSFEVPYLLGSQRINMLSVGLYSSYIRPGIDSIPSTMAAAIVLFVLGGILTYIFGKVISLLIHVDLAISCIQRKHSSKKKGINCYFAKGIYLVILILGLAVAVYMILLSMNSYFRYPSLFPSAFTLEYWKNTFGGNAILYKGLMNSILIGLSTAVLSTVIGFIAARGIAIHYPSFSGKLLFILTIPLFIPGIAMFLGVHQVIIYTPFVNHWTGVVLAHMLICIPYSINIGVSYFKGISPLLEDVAMTLGSNSIKKYISLILPIIAPGIGLSLIISFLVSNTEYFSVFLVGGGNTVTLSMVMYPYISNVDQSMASVTGIVFMVLNLSIFYITNRFLKKSSTYRSLYGGN
jgi:ABC-type spermidine/putrescine transport system permease subunit II